MAESYSVRAILSAVDKGFTSTMRGAQGTIGALGSKIKSGLGFGILTGVGIAAFNGITNSCRNLVSEMNSATATWKTFTSNMQILGKSNSEITGVKKELQSFAEQTIYSSSDMASTYAQLAAVGTKSTLDLVKGFGGLAASAENPKQAMKTLSTQATQMAARPKVAWMDFKLMLDQAPAGMAAVAKEMGMSASELTSKIQAGEVATDDFFAAVEKVGTSEAFAKMARQYKTAGEAMAGLTETLGNKLQPAFAVLSQVAANSIGSIIDSLSKLDGEKIAAKLQVFMIQAGKYIAVLKGDFAEVKSAFGDAFSAIGDSLSKLNGSFGSIKSIRSFASAMDVVKNALVGLAGFLKNNADTIAVLIKLLPKLIAAFIGFKILSSLMGGLSAITSLFGGLSKKTGGATKGVTSLKNGLNSLQRSAGIALIIVSLALLAAALTPLASLGTTAIAPLVTFGVVVAGLGAVFATFGTKLQAGVVGIIVFAAAVSVMALAMTPLAKTGKEGAIAIAAFGIVIAGLVVVFSLFGPLLTAAIPAMLALGATAFLVGAGMALASSFIEALPPVIKQLGDTASQVATAVSEAFATICDGAATVVDAISGGVTSVLDAIAGVIDSIGTAAANAGTGFERVANGIKTISELSLYDIGKSLGAVAIGMEKIAKNGSGIATAATGMSALTQYLSSASGASASLSASLSSLSSAFLRVASTAKTAGNAAGIGFSTSLRSGLSQAPAFAALAISAVTSKLVSGRSGAYSAGAYISQGFAQGMLSCLGTIRTAAAQMVAAADAAVRAKAKIHSPSRIMRSAGQYFGEGFRLGITDMTAGIKKAAESIVTIPNISIPNLATAYSGEIAADYSYYRNASYTVEVPLAVDGKEFARATATYTQDELERQQNRANRKRGIL